MNESDKYTFYNDRYEYSSFRVSKNDFFIVAMKFSILPARNTSKEINFVITNAQ